MPRTTPFVKWAGGKRKIVSVLQRRFPLGFPNRKVTYWEPFVGGGALFFSIADRIEHAVLSDKNRELMTAYQVIKTEISELLEQLEFHSYKHRELGSGHYYAVREQSPEDPVGVAARFLYLNKTCFNGLYRVNKKGHFNVPMGDYSNPNICDESTIRSVNEALKIAEIRSGDYANEQIVHPRSGDFVYCDPPYDEAFTQYVPSGFGTSDQEALFERATQWAKSADVMVSNAQTTMIKCIWNGGGEMDTFFGSCSARNRVTRIKSRKY